MQSISAFLLKKNLATKPVLFQAFLLYSHRGFAYHQNVIDHYKNPRNVGSLDKNDRDVGTGLVGAPACGDVMKL